MAQEDPTRVKKACGHARPRPGGQARRAGEGAGCHLQVTHGGCHAGSVTQIHALSGLHTVCGKGAGLPRPSGSLSAFSSAQAPHSVGPVPEPSQLQRPLVV